MFIIFLYFLSLSQYTPFWSSDHYGRRGRGWSNKIKLENNINLFFDMTTNNYFEVHIAVQKEVYKVCQAAWAHGQWTITVLFINTICRSHADCWPGSPTQVKFSNFIFILNVKVNSTCIIQCAFVWDDYPWVIKLMTIHQQNNLTSTTINFRVNKTFLP